MLSFIEIVNNVLKPRVCIILDYKIKLFYLELKYVTAHIFNLNKQTIKILRI